MMNYQSEKKTRKKTVWIIDQLVFFGFGCRWLTVVRELMRQLPHEEIVYIGDSARAPYGPRPAEQIHEYTWQLVNFLDQDVKMIVIALILRLRSSGKKSRPN